MSEDIVIIKNRPVEQFMENPLDENVLSVRRNILYAVGILLIVGLTQKLLIPGTGESLIFGARETIFLLPIIFCAWWYLFREINEAKADSIESWQSQHEQKYKLFQQESLFKVESLKQDVQQKYINQISKQKGSVKKVLRVKIKNLINDYRNSKRLVVQLNQLKQTIEANRNKLKPDANSVEGLKDYESLQAQLGKIENEIASEQSSQTNLLKQIESEWYLKYRNDDHVRQTAKGEIDFDELFSARLDELVQIRTDPDNYIFDIETNMLLEIQDENRKYRKLKSNQNRFLKNKADKRVSYIKYIFLLALIVFGFGHITSIRGFDGMWKGYQCEGYEYISSLANYLPKIITNRFSRIEDGEKDFYCGSPKNTDIGTAIESLAKNLNISNLFNSKGDSFPISVSSEYPFTPVDSESKLANEIIKELQAQRSLLYSLATKDDQINIHTDIAPISQNAKYKTYFSSGVNNDGILTLSYPAFVSGGTKFESGAQEWVENSIATITKAVTACPGQSKWIHIVGYPDSSCFKSSGSSQCLPEKQSNKKNIDLANDRAKTIKEIFQNSTPASNTEFTAKHWQDDEYRLMMHRAGFTDRFDTQLHEPAPAGLLNRRIDVHVMSAGQCNRKQLLDDILLVSLE